MAASVYIVKNEISIIEYMSKNKKTTYTYYTTTYKNWFQSVSKWQSYRTLKFASIIAFSQFPNFNREYFWKYQYFDICQRTKIIAHFMEKSCMKFEKIPNRNKAVMSPYVKVKRGLLRLIQKSFYFLDFLCFFNEIRKNEFHLCSQHGGGCTLWSTFGPLD